MFNETLLAAVLFALSASPAAGADAPQSPPRPGSTKKTQTTDTIYGSQMMTAEERDAYRAKMRSAKTQAERDQIRKEHHDEMRQRAKDRGVTLPDQPRTSRQAGPRGRGMGPGMGQGMGPDAGMGRGPNR